MADRLTQLDPKIVFIGPPASAMRSLGDKIASTIVAQSANVPCVDWSGKGLACHSSSSIPREIYDQAMVESAKVGIAHAERIGFPVMVKVCHLILLIFLFRLVKEGEAKELDWCIPPMNLNQHLFKYKGKLLDLPYL